MEKYITGKFLSSFRKAMPLEEGVEFRGKTYVVGEDGRHSLTVRTVEKLCENIGLFVKEIQRREGVSFAYSAAVTLPLETCILEQQKKKRGIPSLIDVLEQSLKDAGYHLAGVYPQGVLALEALAEEGKVDPSDSILLIDGGFNTVNVMVLKDAQPLLWVSFYDRGVKQVLQAFGHKLEEKGLAYSLSVPELQRAFLSKSIDVVTEKVDVSDLAEEAVKDYLSSLYEDMIDLLRERGVSFDKVAFVGGLSYYVKGNADVFKKDVYVPEEGGEFLNLKGLISRMEERDDKDWIAADVGFGHVKYAVPVISKMRA
jgi:hypothetical protein